MLTVPAMLLVSVGLLALSLPHHFRTFNPAIARRPDQFRPIALGLRLCGYTLMLVSIALSARQSGWALGLTYWCGWLALTSLVVALGLSIRGLVTRSQKHRSLTR